MQIISKATTQEVQERLVSDLASYLKENADFPLLFMYSGGSSMNLYPLLYEQIKDTRFNILYFAPVDERYDEKGSNFLNFKKLSVYERFKELGVQFVDTACFSTMSLGTIADWYNCWIKLEFANIQESGKGKIVSVLGMGSDGHTAGIFPHQDSSFFNKTFIDTDKLVVGYDVGVQSEYPRRFTLTIPALDRFDRTFVYVTGETKKEVFKRVQDVGQKINEVPAKCWGEMRDVSVYTDLIV